MPVLPLSTCQAQEMQSCDRAVMALARVRAAEILVARLLWFRLAVCPSSPTHAIPTRAWTSSGKLSASGQVSFMAEHPDRSSNRDRNVSLYSSAGYRSREMV